MNRRSKIVSSTFIVLIAIILNIDTIFSKGMDDIFSHIIHCVVEGVIILMFARELRGETWM
jgi:hypothetical protein